MTTAPTAYWQPESECMEREELEQLQLERLEATLSRVYRNVPFYRKHFDELRFDPDEVRSARELRRLPFTTKRDVMDAYPYGLFAVPLREVVRLHASGGTGGAAIVMGYTRNDIRTWSNLMARSYVASGVSADDVVQITFDYGLFTGAFGVHQGAERLGASVIPISSGNSKRQIKIMQDYRSTALVGTPSYVLHLVEVMNELGVTPSQLSLKRVLLGGEPWLEARRRAIEGTLHVTATANYGLPEAMGPGIACECLERDGLHVNEDHFLVEVLDPLTMEPVKDGDKGELVLTTLTKEAFPLVRYRTGDLTSLVPGPCRCGRTSLRIRPVEIRCDDLLVVKGVNVYPSQVEEVLRSVQGTEPSYEIVIERPRAMDEVTVLVEVSESVFFDEMRKQAEFRERLMKKLASELGVHVDVKLVGKKTLERPEGKGPGNVRDLRKR